MYRFQHKRCIRGRGDYVVKVDSIFKSFGSKDVLKGASLQINKGEIVGLVGENGAGKTTLIKIISGLIYANKGEINLDGETVAAFVEQPAFYSDLSGRENMEYFLDRKITDEEISQAPFGCVEFLDLQVRKYSMGMRQKMALWLMFISGADYLLLDEPSVALDVDTVRELDDLLVNIKKEKGILVSSHNFSELQNVCDRVLVLKDGVCHNEVILNEVHRDVYVIKALNTIDEQLMEKLKSENCTLVDDAIEFVGTAEEVAAFNAKLIKNDILVSEVSRKYGYLEARFTEIVKEGVE